MPADTVIPNLRVVASHLADRSRGRLELRMHIDIHHAAEPISMAS